MAKTLTEMAAEIAMAQSSHASLSPDEIADFVRKTFSVLKEIQEKEQGLAAEEPQQTEEQEKVIDLTADPKQSIQRNKVICLECGKEFKQITNRHLKSHGLTAKEYRKKWGFSARQPLAAKSLTAKRRKTAKTLGLGDKLKERRMSKK
jgi:predicted transcriptional regulator